MSDALTQQAAELPDGLQYLCYAWGESDWPVAQFARTRAEVMQFFRDRWFGEPPEQMHPDNRANWDDVMAQFDAPEWDLVDTLEWEFEIGGVRVTKVWECGRASPGVAPESSPAVPVVPAEPIDDDELEELEAALSESHAQLAKFYGVDSLAALVDMQAHHLEKLQAKLPQSPNIFAPQRVREG